MASCIEFKGVGVALVTPFDKDKNIDVPALENLIHHVGQTGGVDFLVVLGTTAETATMTPAEQNEVISTIRQSNTGNLPIMLGMGGNCTAALVEKIRNTDFDGIDSILSVTPYYNKPSQQGMYEHFAAVADASPVPVCLYNVPGRTGVNLKPETVIRLANDFKGKIFGVKEASGIAQQTADIVSALGNDFTVLSGDDNKTPKLMQLGACGVISVSANAFPKIVKTMVSAIESGNTMVADKIYRSLYATTELLFKEGNPTGIKALLNIMGMISNSLRLPLVPATGSLMDELAAQAKSDGLL